MPLQDTPPTVTVQQIEELLRSLPKPRPVVYLNPKHKQELDAKAGAEAPLTHIHVGGTETPLREIIVSPGVPYGVCFTRDNA